MDSSPEDLSRRIREARGRQDQKSSGPQQGSAPDTTAMGKGLRAATDLVAALAVGGFLGFWMDKWLHTKPLFMIVMFFLGFVAGFLNIYRAQTGQDFKIGFKKEKE